MSELTLEFVIDQENELIKGLSSDASERVVATFIRDLFIELEEHRESDLRPADKFLSATAKEQFDHLISEVAEVRREYVNMRDYKGYNDNLSELSRLNLIMELVDLQMSCETMLAILGLDEQQRRLARRNVITKNKLREYYEVAK